MKYLNTVLLLVIITGIAINFYLDNKHYKTLNTRLDNITTAAAAVKDSDISPFNAAPGSPLNASIKPQRADLTTISFEHTAKDFGKVESGPTYTASFKYKNTGNASLFISSADASCGCTVATWSKEAIKPGESGEITVSFDSRGRTGEQLKTVTVTSNTNPAQNVLTLHTFLYLNTK